MGSYARLLKGGLSTEFFCTGDMSLLHHFKIHSIIYLYKYRLINIYSVLWVTIQITWLLIWFQVWPLGALSVGCCVSLTYRHYYCRFFCGGVFFFLRHFLSETARSHIFPLPVLESDISPRRYSIVLLLEYGIRNQDLGD